MTVIYVSGDPLLTRAHTLAFGHNVRGRTELGALETALMNRHPAAFSTYRRLCRKGRIPTGSIWIWHETRPMLAFMAVRASSVGVVRLRYVQAVVLKLARDYQLEGIGSVAIAPLGTPEEWPEICLIIEQWLNRIALPCVIYKTYQPGVQADEGLGSSDIN